MIRHPYLLIDVFARSAFHGNPVAVFFPGTDLSEGVMQAIGTELNLSEVAFVMPTGSPARFRARIFTPTRELPFAGHPMIGILAALHTRFDVTGEVTVHVPRGEVRGWVELRDEELWAGFTLPVPRASPVEVPTAEIVAALGAEPVAPIELYDVGARHFVIALDSRDSLRDLRPDHTRLAKFPDVAFNCYTGSGTTWRNRMFSPAYGVVEDAATGSVAGPLLAHAHTYRDAPTGRPCRIEQGVEIGRFSEMHVRLDPGGDGLRSRTWGQCVTVGRGTLEYPEDQ
ncbi:trans-2,3-dihydro-3-hydroxyanthranilate isomerase [Kitasatospora sp. SolWspMP-SS2h]|uniref:PhzF family phenazine biosynthesis protein n=1 Tax=Kitasatospora sp. SolWspMP-SS2h TaxID=1305729 RepID=UPI000DB936FC|nr:PhzF family phenazine biosynthesis protein [Kitasatospora sp. SolWspMP-SS2h]RAJ43063.1 trans-2,3-dihydro-3-hydroxyanthranilate isomerase [Kitasatospora sp. SolWspMP-SS2h]